MLRTAFVGAVLSLAMTACALETLGPSQAAEQGLEVQLAAPAEVTAHQPFDVRLTITNRRAEPVRLMTPTTCLVTFGVFIQGERVPFEGSLHGCGEAIWHHEIEAGGTLEQTWSLRAELTEPRHAPVSRGSYTVRATPEVMEINGQPARLPDVERRLVVR